MTGHRPRFMRVAAIVAITICLAVSGSVAQSIDNAGTDFIVGFLPQISGNSTQLHITGQVPTMVTVDYPVNSPTFSTTVAVVPGTVTIVTIPVNSAQGWIRQTPQNNAVRLSAAEDFVAYMANIRDFSSDAALALPIDTMNNEYIIASYTGAFHGSDRSEFLVVAAFDDTTITVTPSDNVLSGPAAGVPFSATLQRGEGFLVQALAASNGDLTGSIVESDKPVGVTNGNVCGNVPPGNTACDHMFEVAQPTVSWGNNVLVENLPLRPNGSVYRVLASSDNTTVSLDGAVQGVIGRGGMLEFGPLTGNHAFSADRPIFVVQYMIGQTQSGSNTGDPAMGNMVPSEQYLNSYTFSTVGGSQFASNFLTLIAADGDVGAVLLDGVAIPAASFNAILGSGFSVAAVSLTQGTHTTSSPNPHGITVEGYNDFDSYIYPGGALFEFIDPTGDANPPLCDVDDMGAGTGTDNRPSEDVNGNGVLDPGEDLNGNGEIDEDTGIFFITLLDGSVNLSLAVDMFVPGDPIVGFTATTTDPNFPGVGTVRVTDGAGNTCEAIVQLGEFDPFGGVITTPDRDRPLRIRRPTDDTEGVRCVEVEPGEDPDFTGIDYTPFDANGDAEIDFILTDGDGEKIVCCEFIDDMGNTSPPVCATIILETDTMYIVLESLSAELRPEGVVIRWSTTLEIDNFGFRILRGDGTEDRNSQDLQLVSAALVPAQGSNVQGAIYEFLDTSMGRSSAGSVVYYLEDIDYFGRATRHGPVKVEFGPPRPANRPGLDSRGGSKGGR